MASPLRGDVWLADLSPTRGHEQSGVRPVLVVSVDLYNQGPSSLAVVIPITSTLRPLPTSVRIAPPEGGLRVTSAILCDAIRSVSKERLTERWGGVSATTMSLIEDRLRILLGLP
ncbi:MAG TPA: type II toxin-antitoxin system PemK/MazF family toxin [Chloroflexota bacterium]